MARWRYFPWLALIFGALQVEAQECGETKTSEGNETNAVIQDTADTFVLTKDICTDGHKSAYLSSQCCVSFEDADEHSKFCRSKQPKLTFARYSVNQTIVASKYTECYYKRKNYVKDSHHLNFDQIEADAAKLRDPFKEKYMVDMFRYCGCEAKRSLNELDAGIRDKPDLKLYATTHQCPYFRFGTSGWSLDQKCKTYSRKCKEFFKE